MPRNYELVWADEVDGNDHYMVKTPDGIGHVVYLDGIEAWVTRELLPHRLRGDVVRTKPHRRQLDAIASRWAPMPTPSVMLAECEWFDAIHDRRRRRRNRAALQIRGWSHVT